MNKLYTFIKLYIPFITAIIVAIHGILFNLGYNTFVFYIAQSFIGNSILYLLYVLLHSKRMCKWYKMSICSLMLIHIVNILKKIGLIENDDVFKMTIILCTVTIILWLIFRVTYKTTKAIHSACTRLEEEQK